MFLGCLPAMQKVNEIIMFGGEYTELDSGKVRVYNDLYRYAADKQKWTKVISPNRCVCVCVCVFGGGGEGQHSPQLAGLSGLHIQIRASSAVTLMHTAHLNSLSVRLLVHLSLSHTHTVIHTKMHIQMPRNTQKHTDTCPTRPPPSPSPAPRSAHQAVLHKTNMYVFGGEFTSPNFERFHHFKVSG